MTENKEEKKALLEAALFISHKPLDLDDLKNISDLKESEILTLLKIIENQFNNENFGIELYESPEGYELRVKPEFLDKVSHLTPYSDLKRGQLKVLALVAFKQPIKQSDIVNIIGNRAYNYIKQLTSKNLIKTKKFKRTKVLETTESFMEYFGIKEEKELLEKFKEVFGDREEELRERLKIPELEEETEE